MLLGPAFLRLDCRWLARLLRLPVPPLVGLPLLLMLVMGAAWLKVCRLGRLLYFNT